MKKRMSLLLTFVCILMVASSACATTDSKIIETSSTAGAISSSMNENVVSTAQNEILPSTTLQNETLFANNLAPATGFNFSGKTLSITLGYNGPTYKLHLYDNTTANDIYNHVSNQTWNLSIYDFDGYDNSDKYQYYDVPSRYKITEDNVAITSELIGEVFFMAPSRIIMFFRDAELPLNYTRVGKIEIDADFTKNVEDNPTLAGWGNKIIIIKK